MLYCGGFGHSLLNMFRNIILINSHNHLDLGRIASEYDIFRCKHVGCRDADCTYLMQCQHGEPPLVAPLEDKHDHIPFADSQGFEVGCSLVHILLHLGKGEILPVSPVVNPQHGFGFRCLSRQHIHHIIGEVEVLRNIQLEIIEKVFV